MKSIQNLPQKQQGEFKSIIKLLDNKDYKKGLKHITKLHQQLPDQAEVMSLKAIFLYYTDEQIQGAALAKSALSKNIKSDFCWHIYGLINKANKNYVEAVKCFNWSLKYDNDNLQLLRDLTNLQLHIRDYEGHAETRRTILLKKTNLTANWIAFVIGNHLNGEYNSALEALNSTKKLISNDQQNKLKPVEENELILYNIQLLIEMDKFQDALQLIEESKKQITDRLSLNMFLYQIYSRLNRKEDSIKHVKNLIELQPQNWNYYKLFLSSHQLNLNSQSNYKAIKEILTSSFNIQDNNLLRGRILGFCEVEEFKELFIDFIKPYFQKALPSLFKEIVHLYGQCQKIPIMEECYKELLNENHPSFALWSMMLLAQHFNHINQWEVAYEWIERAIKHTPTLHELYLVKAKILKKQCKFVEALEQVEISRNLDLADRYLNNKSIKYSLNGNLIYQAQDLIRLFLRDAHESNPHDIQTIWYEFSMGKAYLRLNYFGPAFRMFKLIEKHYIEMYEDQIDFYSFAMRKYSIRSLMEMIAYLDNVHNDKYYIMSAILMIQGLIKYLQVIETKQEQQLEGQKKKLTQNEKKRLQKQKEKEEQEKQLRDQFTIEGHIYSQQLRQKLDLSGEKILSTLVDRKSILDEANQFARILINIQNFKYPIQAFQAFKQLAQFYILIDKPILALKSLLGLKKYGVDSPFISHKYQLKVLIYLLSQKERKLDGLITDVIQENLNAILNGLSIKEYNKQFFQGVKITSVLEESIALECSLLADNQAQQDLGQDIVNLLYQKSKSAYEVYQLLSEYDYLIGDRIKPFLQEKYPQLFSFYFEDPNIIWQNKQIEEKKALDLKIQAKLQQ